MVIIISPPPPEAKGDDDSAIWCVTSSTQLTGGDRIFVVFFYYTFVKTSRIFSNNYRIESEEKNLFFLLLPFLLFLFLISSMQVSIET